MRNKTRQKIDNTHMLVPAQGEHNPRVATAGNTAVLRQTLGEQLFHSIPVYQRLTGNTHHLDYLMQIQELCKYSMRVNGQAFMNTTLDRVCMQLKGVAIESVQFGLENDPYLGQDLPDMSRCEQLSNIALQHCPNINSLCISSAHLNHVQLLDQQHASQIYKIIICVANDNQIIFQSEDRPLVIAPEQIEFVKQQDMKVLARSVEHIRLDKLQILKFNNSDAIQVLKYKNIIPKTVVIVYVNAPQISVATVQHLVKAGFDVKMLHPELQQLQQRIQQLETSNTTLSAQLSVLQGGHDNSVQVHELLAIENMKDEISYLRSECGRLSQSISVQQLEKNTALAESAAKETELEVSLRETKIENKRLNALVSRMQEQGDELQQQILSLSTGAASAQRVPKHPSAEYNRLRGENAELRARNAQLSNKVRLQERIHSELRNKVYELCKENVELKQAQHQLDEMQQKDRQLLQTQTMYVQQPGPELQSENHEQIQATDRTSPKNGMIGAENGAEQQDDVIRSLRAQVEQLQHEILIISNTASEQQKALTLRRREVDNAMKENCLLRSQLDEYNKNSTQLQKDISKRDQRIDELNDELESLRDLINQTQDRKKSAQQAARSYNSHPNKPTIASNMESIEEQGQSDMEQEQVASILAEKEEDIKKLTLQLHNEQNTTAALTKELEQANRRKDAIQAELSEIAEKLCERERQCLQLERHSNLLSERCNIAKSQCTDNSSQLAQVYTQNTQLQQEIVKLASEKQHLQEHVQRLESEHQRVQCELNKAREELDNRNNQLMLSHADQDGYRQQSEQLSEQLQKSLQRLNHVSSTIELERHEYEKHVQKFHEETAELKQQNKRMKREISEKNIIIREQMENIGAQKEIDVLLDQLQCQLDQIQLQIEESEHAILYDKEQVKTIRTQLQLAQDAASEHDNITEQIKKLSDEKVDNMKQVFNNEREELRRQIQEEQQNSERLQQALHCLQKEKQDVLRNLQEEICKSTTQATRLKEADSLVEKLNDHIQQARRQNTDLRQQIADLEEALHGQSLQIQAREGDKDRRLRLELQNETLRTQIEGLKQQVASSLTETGTMGGKVNALEDNLRVLQSQNDALRSTISSKDGELSNYLASSRQLEEQVRTLTGRIRQLEMEAHQAHADRQEREDALKRSSQSIADRQQQLQKQVQKLSVQVEEERQLALDKQAEIDDLLRDSQQEKIKTKAYQQQMLHIQEENTRLIDEVQRLVCENNNLQNNSGTNECKINQLNSIVQHLEQLLKEKCAAEQDSFAKQESLTKRIQQEKQQYENDIRNLQQEQQADKEMILAYRDENEQLKQQKKEVAAQLQNYQDKARQLGAQIQQLTCDSNELRAAYNALQGQCQQYDALVTQLTAVGDGAGDQAKCLKPLVSQPLTSKDPFLEDDEDIQQINKVRQGLIQLSHDIYHNQKLQSQIEREKLQLKDYMLQNYDGNLLVGGVSDNEKMQ